MEKEGEYQTCGDGTGCSCSCGGSCKCGHGCGCGSKGMWGGHGHHKMFLVKSILFLFLVGMIFCFGFRLGSLVERANLGMGEYKWGGRSMMDNYGNWDMMYQSSVPSAKQ